LYSFQPALLPSKKRSAANALSTNQSRSDPPRPSGPVSAHRARPRRRERSLREHSYHDKDEWAAGFMHVPIATSTKQSRWRHLTQPGKCGITSGRGGFTHSDAGRFRVAGKQRSYEKSHRSFFGARAFMDPPLEVVHILSKEKKSSPICVCQRTRRGRCRWCLRSTASTAARKISPKSFGAILPFGIGYLAVDGPGHRAESNQGE